MAMIRNFRLVEGIDLVMQRGMKWKHLQEEQVGNIAS